MAKRIAASIKLEFLFKDGSRNDLPSKLLASEKGHLIPLVGDKVVFETDGSWNVTERYFAFDESPVAVRLMLAR
jgi:hypothetical protein